MFSVACTTLWNLSESNHTSRGVSLKLLSLFFYSPPSFLSLLSPLLRRPHFFLKACRINQLKTIARVLTRVLWSGVVQLCLLLFHSYFRRDRCGAFQEGIECLVIHPHRKPVHGCVAEGRARYLIYVQEELVNIAVVVLLFKEYIAHAINDEDLAILSNDTLPFA